MRATFHLLDAKKNAPAITKTAVQNAGFNAKITDAHRAKGVVINAPAMLQKNKLFSQRNIANFFHFFVSMEHINYT